MSLLLSVILFLCLVVANAFHSPQTLVKKRWLHPCFSLLIASNGPARLSMTRNPPSSASSPTTATNDEECNENDKKCHLDFNDPAVYTFQTGAKQYLFKMEQSNKFVDSFTNQPMRSCVTLPDEEDKNDNTFWMDLMESIDERTPLEWDILSIARSARKTRLLKNRAYAREEPFSKINIPNPPTLKDLAPPPPKFWDTFWITTPARVASFLAAYLLFPYITQFLDHFVTMEPQKLDEITSKFGPGISILYGTFVSLTLSILYTRQQQIQDDAAIESSILVGITRNLLSLFRNDETLAQEAGQCAADQVRILVKGSRGGELVMLMYSDPYARMLELVDCFEEKLLSQGDVNLGGRASLIGSCRDMLKDLFRFRANRLSNEALALPGTHYFILTILTCLIALSYAVSILPTVDITGSPSNEARLIFAFLATIYIIFYNFASDLNNPFSGVYQVRRSATASHLLALKWLIANHPVTKAKINFDEAESEYRSEEFVKVRSPGLGDLMFDRNDIYPDRTNGDTQS